MTQHLTSKGRINISERDLSKNSVRDKYFSYIGIILTDKCNIKCRHCYFSCTSTSTSDWNQLELNNLIKDAKTIDSVKTVGFSGGEPFLEFKKLIFAVNTCDILDLKSTVVTNGFWAPTYIKTRKKLEKIQKLDSITVSADKFHQEFIPIQNVRNIIEVAKELDIECHIQTCHLNDPQHEINQIKNQLKDYDGFYTHTSQPVQLYGRASINFDLNQLYTYDATKMTCPAADNILILTNGDVFGCCNPPIPCQKENPLYLGNVHCTPIKEIWKIAEKNPIIHILRLWGPDELNNIVQKEAYRQQIKITPPSKIEKQEICSLCRYVLEDNFKIGLLRKALSQNKLLHEVAVSRLIKFGEKSMLVNEEPAINTQP